MVLQSLQHGAAWLVCVGAVAETALAPNLEQFAEIMAHLLALEIEGAETTDARRVDDGSGGDGRLGRWGLNNRSVW